MIRTVGKFRLWLWADTNPMATAFTRSIRTIQSDRGTLSAIGATAGIAICAAWAAWFIAGRVTLVEVSDQARLEVAAAISPVQAPLPGRVTSSALAIERIVKEGEVLVELDAATQKLELEEQSVRLTAFSAEVEALNAQIASEEQTRMEERRSAALALEQAEAHEREAAAPAAYNADELGRLAELRRLGLIAEREYARGKAEAERSRAAVSGSRIGLNRIAQEQRAKDSERESRIRRLRAEAEAIEGQMRAVRVTMDRLAAEIARRTIRAPASGRIGEAKDLRPGTVVSAGEQLASIVPEGDFRVVAWFSPTSAMGRLRAGQPARMRMQGFPWAQYGVLNASVTRVAGEMRDGMVRVELAAAPGSSFRVALQHGMPGSVEVEVDRISPAALVLRLTGRWITIPGKQGERT